ncbi:MAG: hypothetical protein AAF152_00465, partial [Cyanobacteria bacterium P01_A01_bin.114]
LTVATASVYLIARFSPFTQLQRTLLAFGYFNLYEYAVISRSYALGVFFVFLFCSLYGRYQTQLAAGNMAWNALILPFGVLGLLANTSVYGLFLSGALSIALLWPLTRQRLSVGWFWGGMGWLWLSWLTCYLQIKRVDSSFSVGSLPGVRMVNDAPTWRLPTERVLDTGAHVWRSYVPIPEFWRDAFWGGNALLDSHHLPAIAELQVGKILAFLLSLVLVSAVVRVLWYRPKWLCVYAAGTVVHLLFSYFFFGGFLRHHGHLFILLVACLWLANTDDSTGSLSQPADRVSMTWSKLREAQTWLDPLSSQWQKSFLTGLLSCQVLAGVMAYSTDFSQPFSASRMTADYLRSHQLDHLTILGYRDRQAATLSGYLSKQIYYPNRQAFGSFWELEQDIPQAELVTQIQAFVSRSEQPVVLALTEALEQPIPNLTLQPLATLKGKVVVDETFYLYLASPPGLEFNL